MGRDRKRPDEHGRYQCTLCLVYKDRDQYYASSSSANLLQSRCIDCMKLTQAANHLATGIPVYLETYFPYATRDQLNDFAEVLKEWKRYPISSRAGKIMMDNVREWLTFFRDQDVATGSVSPRTKVPSGGSADDLHEPEPLNWAKPGVKAKPGTTITVPGGYVAQVLGPPKEVEKPSWYDKWPDDMTDREFTVWRMAGLPKDPSERP
jgi:hypothetical protein